MFGLVMVGIGGFILYLVVWPSSGDKEHTRLELFLSQLGFPLEGLDTTIAPWSSGGQGWGNGGAGGSGAGSGFDGGTGNLPGSPSVDPDTRNGDAVTRALSVIGTPYLFGGTNPFKGIDCSALVQWAFANLGKALPRTAQQQYNVADQVSSPQRGDLVFFTGTYPTGDYITHVGIYLGDGRMVSARNGGVGVDGITSGYWRDHFVGYGRV